MKITTTNLASWSSPPYIISSTINYKDTFFEQENLTPIRGKTTFRTLQKIQNDIKANANSAYYNFGGRPHVHISLMLTNAQYSLILNMPFVYATHPCPLIIPDGIAAHTKSNMIIAHTKEVSLFRKVTGVYQYLMQQVIDTVEEGYLKDIYNQITNVINNTLDGVITHF